MRKNILKMSKFYLGLLSITILIFLIGILSIMHSSSIYEYPKYNKYYFSFYAFAEDGSIVNFSEFRTTYRFDEETGTFSFKSKESLNRISIFMPEEYELLSVQHFVNHSQENFPFELEKSENKKFLKIIFLKETKEEWMLISVKMKLSPNAKFSFQKNSLWGGTSHFYFNMGEEFECTRQDCFFNLLNTHIDRSGVGTQQESSSSIGFVNQSIEEQSSINHEFEISARSRTALTRKTFWLSLGSSIIAGAIFVIFSIIIAIHQQNIYPKRKY